jgi:hypothetical protein
LKALFWRNNAFHTLLEAPFWRNNAFHTLLKAPFSRNNAFHTLLKAPFSRNIALNTLLGGLLQSREVAPTPTFLFFSEKIGAAQPQGREF